MKIAGLGLGILGSAWAKNLIADGHELRCWNRAPRAFKNFTRSIQEAVTEAEAIFVLPFMIAGSTGSYFCQHCNLRYIVG
jgi:3-hydroxyisobutyrate dehydrogenase-like beta-hydroxyacid dehydrogenase